jgi:glutamate dehydrogenase (NAD(P)+)
LFAAQGLFEDIGRKVSDFTYAIQGFGNVGSWVARLLHAEGGKIIAVSDASGATRNPAGLDIPALYDHSVANKTVPSFAGGDAMPSNALLAEPCDVLVPAALGGVLNRETAPAVRARYIFEGANHPTDPDADEVFAKKGIVVLPDIYANAGGVTVSYFEWVQNVQQFYWDEQRVNTELRTAMRTAYTHVKATATRFGCDFRTAAFALGISRVARATALRGV